MGGKIFIKDIEVLDLQNKDFSFFYESLLEILKERKMTLSEDLIFLIDELYVGCFGVGLDLADLLKTKKDIMSFAELARLAIEPQKESKSLSPELEHILMCFHQSILDYGDTLIDR